MRGKNILALAFCLLAGPAWAQESVAAKVRRYADIHRAAIVTEFLKLVALPNIHGDAPALQRNAVLLRTMMQQRGLETELWGTSGGVPVVFGQKIVPGATRTILFYIHYDGQPVDPKRWAQPDPFRPVIRTASIEAGGMVVTNLSDAKFPDDWRIYARAAGDDKAPIEAILCALDAVGTPEQNVKIILDGEEEGGGPGLPEVIAKFPDKLKSDLLVILDGPQHPSGRPTMFYGARGGVALNVTVFTAKQGMHSGNYGNWMPDANVRLAQLISAMVDPSGKVAIPGFYSEVLPFPPAARASRNGRPALSEYGYGRASGRRLSRRRPASAAAPSEYGRVWREGARSSARNNGGRCGRARGSARARPRRCRASRAAPPPPRSPGVRWSRRGWLGARPAPRSADRCAIRDPAA